LFLCPAAIEARPSAGDLAGEFTLARQNRLDDGFWLAGQGLNGQPVPHRRVCLAAAREVTHPAGKPCGQFAGRGKHLANVLFCLNNSAGNGVRHIQRGELFREKAVPAEVFKVKRS